VRLVHDSHTAAPELANHAEVAETPKTRIPFPSDAHEALEAIDDLVADSGMPGEHLERIELLAIDEAIDPPRHSVLDRVLRGGVARQAAAELLASL